MKIKAGKYIITDLCYVIPYEYWNELCSQWLPSIEESINTGKIISYYDDFLDKNVECYALPTPHANDVYFDNLENKYKVNSGLIGIILYHDVQDHLSIDSNVFYFEDDFEVYSNNGYLNFADVTIDTNY